MTKDRKNTLSRRGLLQTSAGTLLAGAAGAASIGQAMAQPAYTHTPAKRLGMPQEGPDTPKITMYMNNLLSDDEAIRLKQIGINWIDCGGMPAQPWTIDYLQPRVDLLKKHDMHIGIMMVRWAVKDGMDPNMLKIVYGLPGRDEEIAKIKQSLVNFGKLGIPVMEWNFFPYRATDGYGHVPGRGGASYLEFNYDRMKDLPPLPAPGAHTYDEIWKNMAYFLKEVIPVAEKNNVVMSVHPNDPPSPKSRGFDQVLNSFYDWRRLVETVNSPSNCLTWDCGVTRELGEDPVTVGNWFASRNRIGQVHFRNVVMRKPREDYTEVFVDTGEDDMFDVMKLLIQNNYKRLIMPEHPVGLAVDKALGREYGSYVGWTYNVAYCRAMMQVALRQVRGI
jgi:mannonate dehydratase